MKKTTLMLLVAAFMAGQTVSAQPGPRFMHQAKSHQNQGKGQGNTDKDMSGRTYGKGFGWGHAKNDSTATDSTRTHRGWGHFKNDSTATDTTRNHRGWGRGNHFGFGQGKGHQGFGQNKGHRGGFGGFKMKADSFYVNNTISVANVSAAAGSASAVLPIVLSNDSVIKSVYFSLQLPEGITLAKDADDKYLVQLNADRATEDHTVFAMPGKKGSVTFRLSSQKSPYVGNSGVVAFVTLNLDNTLPEGEYTIDVTNLGVKDANDKRHAAPDATATLIIGTNDVKAYASDATAIQGVSETTVAPRYDLNGRTVSASRNVYIQNGKKYIKK